MVPSAIGAVQGSMIRNRMSHLNRNSRIRSSVSMFDSTRTVAMDVKVKMQVFSRDFRNVGSFSTAAKFPKPTIWKSGFPTVTLLKL